MILTANYYRKIKSIHMKRECEIETFQAFRASGFLLWPGPERRKVRLRFSGPALVAFSKMPAGHEARKSPCPSLKKNHTFFKTIENVTRGRNVCWNFRCM